MLKIIAIACRLYIAAVTCHETPTSIDCETRLLTDAEVLTALHCHTGSVEATDYGYVVECDGARFHLVDESDDVDSDMKDCR